MTSQLIGRSDMRRMFGISMKTAEKWTNQESFPTHVKVDRRKKFWNKEAVQEWVDANCVQAATYGGWRLRQTEGEAGE